MQYDPIKQSIGKLFKNNPLLRILFYKLLNILLLRTWHIKKEISRLKHIIPHAPEILDAGSGFGQYSYYLAEKFKKGRITGIDINEGQISDCNTFARATRLSERLLFRVADLLNFHEPDKYDLILSVDVMEHIEEDIRVFKNLYGSLKKGGVLLISTPSDMGGSDVHHDGDKSFIDEHVREGYGIEDIYTRLKQAGFLQADARYSYGKPGKLSWILSMKYPISLLNSSKIFFILLPFYYLIVFPFCLILNFADVRVNHASGTGLIVKAVK